MVSPFLFVKQLKKEPTSYVDSYGITVAFHRIEPVFGVRDVTEMHPPNDFKMLEHA